MKRLLIALSVFLIVVACSEDNGTGSSEEFTRIAFVYQPAATHQNQIDFKTFLVGRGYVVQEFTMDQILTADFSSYHLIIIDSWIGAGDDWGSIAQGNALLNSNLPILGLGFGGARFFGEIGLTIGWDNGDYFPDSSINSTSILNTQVTIADGRIHADDAVFTTPDLISITQDTLISVYHHSGVIAIDRENNLADSVKFYGRRPEFATQYTLISEGGRYFLWGFTNSPGSMTENGKNFFVNVVEYMAGR